MTSLTRAECRPKYLYEKVYCARGEMENRMKECPATRSLCRSHLDRHDAGKSAAAVVRLDGLRATLRALRRIGLHHTPFANASCGTIRLKLLKIGALVRISVRRIKIAMASGCPAAPSWCDAAVRLNAAANARGSPA